jgi:hypothetical protein
MLLQCSHLNNLVHTLFNEPAPVESKSAIRISAKWDAFALVTYWCHAKNNAVTRFDYSEGILHSDWIYNNKEGGKALRAKAAFRYSGHTGFLDIDFYEIESKQVASSQDVYGRVYYKESWKSDTARSVDLIECRNRVLADLESMQRDSNSMRECRDFFRSNFRYNYLCMRTISMQQRPFFFSRYLRNAARRWEFPVVRTEKNRNKRYEDYTFEVVFKHNVPSSSLLPQINDTLYIHLFTNDESWLRISSGTVMTGEGILDSADYSFSRATYGFYLKE